MDEIQIETCDDCPHYDGMNGVCTAIEYEDQLCPLVDTVITDAIVRIRWNTTHIFDAHLRED